MRRGSDSAKGDGVVAKLQRSRTRVSAERQSAQAGCSDQDATSTEPHSCECGEDANILQLDPRKLTSTEPHSCECGEQRVVSHETQSFGDFNGAALV